MIKKHSLIIFIILALALSGCNFFSLVNPPEPTPIPPTPTALPPIEMTICVGSELGTLFPFKAVSRVQNEILSAVYDGPIDMMINGEKQAAILTQVPTTENGAVQLSSVSVTQGDVVADSYGDLVSLQAGTTVFPAGCTTPDCVITWDGASELQLDQMTITYELIDGLTWSDGQPLKASDSLYGFSLAADPATPVVKRDVDLTISYTAEDERTLQWVGVPGLITGEVERFFWQPMPEHLWGGFSVEDLLTEEISARTPVGWGPFVIDAWNTGKSIRMVKNPNYFRADEGLPAADILTFKFLGDLDTEAVSAVSAAGCDLVAPSAIGMQSAQAFAENTAGYTVQNLLSREVELLAIGITPSSYDDNYYPFGVDRPDIFGDARTRQAIAKCIDRTAIVNDLLAGAGEAAVSLLDPAHPLLQNLSLSDPGYDTAGALELLKQAGWQDHDLNPATPLMAISVANVPAGTFFEVELLTSEAPLRGQIAQWIADGLAGCGIQTVISTAPVNTLYQPGPDGPLFGRDFDLALLSWQTEGRFDCQYFLSSEIPSEANFWLGEKTGGANFYGYRSEAYDAACRRSLQSSGNFQAAQQARGEAVAILQEELPLIPLYHHREMVLLSDGVATGPNPIHLWKNPFTDIEQFRPE